MEAKRKNIVTYVTMNLGQDNTFCKYPGKMVTIGTMSIALYWLVMLGMVVNAYYHHHINVDIVTKC